MLYQSLLQVIVSASLLGNLHWSFSQHQETGIEISGGQPNEQSNLHTQTIKKINKLLICRVGTYISQFLKAAKSYHD